MILLLQRFGNYPLVIRVALIISLLAVMGLVMTYSIILIKRYKGNNADRKKQKLIQQFEELAIPHIVLNPGIGTVAIEDIQLPVKEYNALGLYKDPQIRSFFTRYLMNLSDNLSGNVHLLIKRLYQELGLAKYALRMLHSGKRNIVLGLHELSFFNVRVDEPLIYRLMSHPDKLVQEKSTCYALKMFTDPMYALSTIKERFSTWTMVDYFEIIRQRADVSNFNFADWIRPGNSKSMVLLCVNLAVYFQQVDAGEAMIALLDTPDIDFKKKLINGTGRLFYAPYSNALEQQFSLEQDNDVKMEILKAIGRMGNPESIPFLQQVFKEEQNVLLMKHAAYSLYNMNVSRDALVPLYNNVSEKEGIILNYVQNPLIKYI